MGQPAVALAFGCGGHVACDSLNKAVLLQGGARERALAG